MKGIKNEDFEDMAGNYDLELTRWTAKFFRNNGSCKGKIKVTMLVFWWIWETICKGKLLDEKTDRSKI